VCVREGREREKQGSEGRERKMGEKRWVGCVTTLNIDVRCFNSSMTPRISLSAHIIMPSTSISLLASRWSQ